MDTNSTSQTVSAEHDHPECPQCVKLASSKAELLGALEGIAAMHVDEDTDHHQLSALCMAIALTAIKAAKGDAS